MATRVQTGCPFEALPDNLVTTILGLAAATHVSSHKAAEFRKLARLRTVSSQFSRLALQVDGIVCKLDRARAMDARILLFLQEAEAIKKLVVKCKRDGGEPMSSLAGFITAALILTPRLECFHLDSGNLLLAGRSDEPAQQVFQALAKCCPLVKIIELHRCQVFLERPLHVAAPFHNLKELSFRGSMLQSTESLLEFSLDQVAPKLEKLVLDGVPEVSRLRVESRTLKTLILDQQYLWRLRKVEIDTSQLEELKLIYSAEMRIHAPELRTLRFEQPPAGPVLGTPWKVTELTIEGSWHEESLLQVLELSPKLEDVVFSDFSFSSDDIPKAYEIMAHLARVKHLDASMELLRTLTLQSRELLPNMHSRKLVLPVAFTNLTNAYVTVNNMEELQLCVSLVEESPKLGCLEIDMQSVKGELVGLVETFLGLQNMKPDLALVVLEPNFVSAQAED